MHKVLIIDNEPILTRELTKSLSVHNFCVSVARNIKESRELIANNDFHIIITELRLPDGEGTELLELAPHCPVIITTSYASLRSAVDSMRMGAVDYVPKPFDHNDLVRSIKNILNKPQAKPKPRKSSTNTPRMIGESPAMQKVFNVIHKVAVTDVAVLIHGEPGTGKELAAQFIHCYGHQSNHPFISVNCAAITQEMLEAELFGSVHKNEKQNKGLIAAADTGTLFLEEIQELSLETQAKLLRILQEGKIFLAATGQPQVVDIRLISASSKNLQQLCQEGLFREELYYRINVVDINLPPLRERSNDAITIAQTILEELSTDIGCIKPELDEQAIQNLTTYNWPGNIRELKSSLQRAIILRDEGQLISTDLLGINFPVLNNDVQFKTKTTNQTQGHSNQVENDPPEGLSLEDYFTRFVIENEGAMSETALAKKLGISRKCLWERRQKLGIPRQKTNESL